MDRNDNSRRRLDLFRPCIKKVCLGYDLLEKSYFVVIFKYCITNIAIVQLIFTFSNACLVQGLETHQVFLVGGLENVNGTNLPSKMAFSIYLGDGPR